MTRGTAWFSRKTNLNQGTQNIIILQQVQNEASQVLSNCTSNKLIAKETFQTPK